MNVLANSDITVGNVFTSEEDEITSLGGNLNPTNTVAYNQHDDIDLSFMDLADHTLEPGETAVIQLEFSDGVGSGAGHHLFLVNLSAGGYTTVTPTAVTVGSLAGDVVTTDSNGDATAEFAETDPVQFYMVESAP